MARSPDLRDDGCVQVIGTQLWEELVDDPERDGHQETDDVSPRDPLITLSMRKELVREATPRYGLRIILLGLLARPDICALY